MSTDFVTLLMRVDATGMIPGEQALDRLAVKGEAAERKVVKSTAAMTRGMDNVGKGANRLGPAIQNASYQVGDFAVQIASGQSAAVAFAQQFPQLAGGMGVWGAALGAAVAVGAAAIPMLFDVGRGAKSADEALDRLTDTIDLYQQYAGMAAQSTDKLLEKFGTFGLRIREISKYMAEVSMGELRDGLEENVEPIKGALSEIQQSMAMLIEHREMLTNMGITEAIGGPLWEQAKVSIEGYQAAIDKAAETMGLMPDQAIRLAGAMDKMKSAKAMHEIAYAAANALAIMQEFKANGMELPGPLRGAAKALEEISVSAGQAAQTTDTINNPLDRATDATWNWASAMGSVGAELRGVLTAVNALSGSYFSNAARMVELEALQAGQSAREAASARKRFEIGREYDMKEESAGTLLERMAIRSERELALKGIDLDDAISAARSEALRRDRTKSKTGGSSSKRDKEAFGRSVIDIQRQTEAFLANADALAKVATAGGDWERELAILEQTQKLMNDAQRSGVEMTPQVTESIRAMAEAYVDAETKMDGVREATERGRDAFRNLAGSVIEGADSMKSALASLLMEMAKVQMQNAAMKAMSAAGGGGLFGLLGTLLTPWGGGRATGGPVSSGTSYLVGEQGPEVITMGGNGYVTPNHALPGGPSISIHVDARGATEGTAELISRKINEAVPNIVAQAVGATKNYRTRGHS